MTPMEIAVERHLDLYMEYREEMAEERPEDEDRPSFLGWLHESGHITYGQLLEINLLGAANEG